jgi:hypothetical protein
MRRSNLLVTIASLAISIIAARSQAAIISVLLPNSVDQNATVSIEGLLAYDDADQFQTKTSALSRATVALRSDGGSVVAGMRIGEAIRLKGFRSVVVGRCASACALAWLGGTPRFMADGAQIGFHAAFDPQSGHETGVGNAVIGAYLTRIGLPYEAVVYITTAAPNSMTWLTVPEAKRNGIDVKQLNASPRVLDTAIWDATFKGACVWLGTTYEGKAKASEAPFGTDVVSDLSRELSSAPMLSKWKIDRVVNKALLALRDVTIRENVHGHCYYEGSHPQLGKEIGTLKTNDAVWVDYVLHQDWWVGDTYTDWYYGIINGVEKSGQD